MSLVARALEAAGIPTVVFGTAKDIVEHCGVARHVFVDFPLGNPVGKPFDEAMQHQILELGLSLLETAQEPRTTVQAPVVWEGDVSWKELIFSDERPFLEGEAYENWMAAKDKYREQKGKDSQ